MLICCIINRLWRMCGYIIMVKHLSDQNGMIRPMRHLQTQRGLQRNLKLFLSGTNLLFTLFGRMISKSVSFRSMYYCLVKSMDG